jgi:Fe-S cluster assembly scaffold protein SufB
MKTNSKKQVIFLALATAGIFFAFDAFAISVNPGNSAKAQDKKDEMKAELQNKFCEKISNLAEKISQRFSEKQNRVQIRAQERLSKWEDNQNIQEARLTKLRSARDANLEESLNILQERAPNEAQKTAVNKFRETMRTAIETRRNAMDETNSTFRNSVKKLNETRKSDLNENISAFIDAQKKALEKATSGCQNEINPVAARNSLHSALNLAKTNYNVQKQNRERIKTQMEALIQTRKKVIEKTNTDFKSIIEQAKIELKKALDEEVNTSASTE